MNIAKVASKIVGLKTPDTLCYHEMLALMGILFQDCDIACKTTIPIKIFELFNKPPVPDNIRGFTNSKLKTIRMKKLGFIEFNPSNKTRLLKLMIADGRCAGTSEKGMARMKIYQFSYRVWKMEFEKIQKTGCYDIDCSICEGKRLVEEFLVAYRTLKQVESAVGKGKLLQLLEEMETKRDIEGIMAIRIPVGEESVQKFIERVKES